MEQTFAVAALWVGLALVATFLGTRFKISNALMEITVGIVAGAVATHYFGPDAMGAKLPWLTFIAKRVLGGGLEALFDGPILNKQLMTVIDINGS